MERADYKSSISTCRKIKIYSKGKRKGSARREKELPLCTRWLDKTIGPQSAQGKGSEGKDAERLEAGQARKKQGQLSNLGGGKRKNVAGELRQRGNDKGLDPSKNMA